VIRPPIQSADYGDIRGSTCNTGARGVGWGGEQAGRAELWTLTLHS
jgi:hypothetical protein